MVRNRTSTGSLECAVGVAQSNYSRGVAQWLARNVRDLEVGGSNPPPPDGARPLKTSQTNEDTSPRHYRRSTGPWDALKYQRAKSTPAALKRTRDHLRQKFSPSATPADTDQRAAGFAFRQPDEDTITPLLIQHISDYGFRTDAAYLNNPTREAMGSVR